MSMLTEALQGEVGEQLVRHLDLQLVRANGAVARAARSEDIAEVRYHAGISDGISRAIDVVQKIREGNYA